MQLYIFVDLYEVVFLFSAAHLADLSVTSFHQGTVEIENTENRENICVFQYNIRRAFGMGEEDDVAFKLCKQEYYIISSGKSSGNG